MFNHILFENFMEIEMLLLSSNKKFMQPKTFDISIIINANFCNNNILISDAPAKGIKAPQHKYTNSLTNQSARNYCECV